MKKKIEKKKNNGSGRKLPGSGLKSHEQPIKLREKGKKKRAKICEKRWKLRRDIEEKGGDAFCGGLFRFWEG